MTRRASKKSSIPDGKARLNLLLEEDLKRWAVDFAGRKNSSLTALISGYFRFLKQIDEAGGDTTELLVNFRAAMKEFESDLGVEQI